MIVIVPAAVAFTMASIIPFVPAAKCSNSNTPGGLHRNKTSLSTCLRKHEIFFAILFQLFVETERMQQYRMEMLILQEFHTP